MQEAGSIPERQRVPGAWKTSEELAGSQQSPCGERGEGVRR